MTTKREAIIDSNKSLVRAIEAGYEARSTRDLAGQVVAHTKIGQLLALRGAIASASSFTGKGEAYEIKQN